MKDPVRVGGEPFNDPGGHAVILNSSDGKNTYVLNRYFSSTSLPRPESFFEDEQTAAELPDQGLLYDHIAAAAESGWDFSTRWMDLQGTQDVTCPLDRLVTTKIIPTDLNAILLRMERTLAIMHEITSGEISSSNLATAMLVEDGAWDTGFLWTSVAAQQYAQAAEARLAGISDLLWSTKYNTWLDFRLDQCRVIDATMHQAASNYIPLWAGCMDNEDQVHRDAVLQSLVNSGLLEEGGVLTTRLESGQQWDAPNAWPPLQFFIVKGLCRLRTQVADDEALRIARAWINSNLKAWAKSGLMYEKYDAIDPGHGGGGGEYVPQVGFGWSNGVILSLMSTYGDALVS